MNTLNLREAKHLLCEVEFAMWSLERKFGQLERVTDKKQAVEDVLFYMDWYKDKDIDHAVRTWYQEVEHEIEEGQEEPDREEFTHDILGLLRVV